MFLKINMKNRFIALLSVLFMVHCSAWAENIGIVQLFGKNLAYWASSKDTSSALESMERLCSQNNPSILIGDNIMSTLASNYNLEKTETYRWDNYTACMEKEISKGINISVTDIKSVPTSLIPERYRKNKTLSFVSCNIKITGASNFNENDLFILQKNKIVKIQQYQVAADKKGRRRLRVDLSDLGIDDDTEGWGASYHYSKLFPVGASVSYSYSKFMVSVDFGANLDNNLYTKQKVDFNNIVDYSITREEYDLKFYMMATPAFYLKYFSVGWGLGVADLDVHKYTKNSSITNNENGSIIHTSGSTKTSGGDVKFMMRPIIKGYIPCNDNLFISLSVSYDWILGYKNTKNGIGFGAGIHFLID